MPADLETDFALSALPAYLRGAATVYLLDPEKGYYIARKGTNGFCAFVDRTDWEWGDFVQDSYTAISYDAEGVKTYMPIGSVSVGIFILYQPFHANNTNN
jgi:hypothetical protein